MVKIIINNRTSLDDLTTMRMVYAVVEQGKISKTGRGEQYCFCSVFGYNNEEFVVSVSKTKTGTESFTVFPYKQDTDPESS